MAIIQNPIELDVLDYILPSATKLILQTRKFLSTFENDPIKKQLIDSCMIGQVSNGYGIVFDFKVALQTVRNLDGNASLFDEEKPQMVQETMEIDEYKVVLITMASQFIAQARRSQTGVNDLIAWLLGLAPETIEDYLYQRLLTLIKTWGSVVDSTHPPLQATQTLTIDLIDLSKSENLIADELHNSKKIVKELDKLAKDMTRLTPKYQEITEYKDSNDGKMKKVQTQTPKRNMRLIINAKTLRDINADTLSMLYNKEQVGSMLPSDGLIELPDGDVGDDNIIGWFGHKNKFALLYFYRLAESFRNGIRLKTNYYNHFAFCIDYFRTAPMVKIVANYIDPAVVKKATKTK